MNTWGICLGGDIRAEGTMLPDCDPKNPSFDKGSVLFWSDRYSVKNSNHICPGYLESLVPFFGTLKV